MSFSINISVQIGHVIQLLTQRREQLGMSDYHIAQRSGVSQPTVYRILSGKNPQASFANIMAIAEAVGVTLVPKSLLDITELREQQADKKVAAIMDMTQATSALEGQGMREGDDQSVYFDTKKQLKQKLLAGPAKDLWSE